MAKVVALGGFHASHDCICWEVWTVRIEETY